MKEADYLSFMYDYCKPTWPPGIVIAYRSIDL